MSSRLRSRVRIAAMHQLYVDGAVDLGMMDVYTAHTPRIDVE